MKRILSIVSSLLGLLALGVLVAILVLTFRGLEGEVEPTFQSSPVAIETETSPSSSLPETLTPSSPPVTPTALATSVSLCTFAGHPATIEPGPPLDAFIFSEPQVVLTHTSAIGIAGWLPDGERLLITRDIPGTNRQSIETFNTRTGEIQVYAQREGANGKPVWLLTLGAVAYTTLAEGHPELWISQSPQQGERVALDVQGLSLAVEPDGKHLWYFSRANPTRPQRLNVGTGAIRQASLDFASLLYPKPGLEWVMRNRSPGFRMVWHPEGSKVVLYSQFWTFLLDTRTNQVCELELGEFVPERMDIPPWALEAQWSPNGRYLAFITTDNLNAPFRRTELTILDMGTGEWQTLSPGPDLEPGQHYVYDIAWASNSQQLITLAQTGTSQGRPIQKLYLIDVLTRDSRQVMPDHAFGGGAIEGWQLAWSPKGQILAIKCPTWLETEPTIVEDRICLIAVILKP